MKRFLRSTDWQKYLCTFSLGAGILLSHVSIASAQNTENYHTGNLCLDAARLAEQAAGLPEKLLVAISLTESGRTDNGTFAAWPWTVNVSGNGTFLPTREAGVHLAEKSQARGITNIDVGCMQINLEYHGRAFNSVDQAMDPIENTAYAAAFLSELYMRHGSWGKAVAYYHSAKPERAAAYQNRVLTHWQRLQTQSSLNAITNNNLGTKTLVEQATYFQPDYEKSAAQAALLHGVQAPFARKIAKEEPAPVQQGPADTDKLKKITHDEAESYSAMRLGNYRRQQLDEINARRRVMTPKR